MSLGFHKISIKLTNFVDEKLCQFEDIFVQISEKGLEMRKVLITIL